MKKEIKYINFTRLFDQVKRNTEMTGNGKIIFTDILSFQLDGKEYKKTSKTIGFQCGISEAQAQKEITKLKSLEFVEVDKYDYIVSPEGGKPKKIRHLKVVNPEKWLTTLKQSDDNKNTIAQNEIIVSDTKVKPKKGMIDSMIEMQKKLEILTDKSKNIIKNTFPDISFEEALYIFSMEQIQGLNES
jgi:hypothetical protein